MNPVTKQLSVLAAIPIGLGAIAAAHQDPRSTQSPVFQAAANYVQIDVRVTGPDGRPVTDLSPDDVTIVENGTRQTIAEFSFVDIPAERAEPPLNVDGRPLEADVLSNGRPEGHVYFIVLDDLHITAATTNKARAVARTFVEQHVGPNDLAAITFTGRAARDVQDFTNNRSLLLAAVNRLVGRGIDRREVKLPGAKEEVAVNASAKASERRQTIRALADVLNFLETLGGRRKAMLLVSEGFPLDRVNALGHDPFNPDTVGQDLDLAASTGFDRDFQQTISAARRAGVSIYPVDPIGLETPVDADAPIADDGSLSGRRPRAEEVAANRAAASSNLAGLRGLAADTGGFAIVNTNSFETLFDRLVAENSSHYLMGYYTGERRDASTLPTVRVNRPGVRVRVIVRGSVQPSGNRRPRTPRPELASRSANAILDASRSPVPVNDVGIRVASSILKGTASKNATVALVTDVDVSRFAFAETGGTFDNDNLVLRFLTTGADGKIRPPIDRYTIDLKLQRVSYERAQKHGVRLMSRLLLPPGRYQVRVVAGHETDEAGSVIYDLDVPDFSKLPLAMSGVLFTSSSDADVFTVRLSDPERRQWWSTVDFATTPATTWRSFSSTETVGLVTEFYAKNIKTLRALAVRADLLNPDGQVVKTLAETKAPSTMDGDRFLFRPGVSLRNIPPGRYVLRVEGRVGSSNALRATRNIELHIGS